jgi:protein SCO1/2
MKQFRKSGIVLIAVIAMMTGFWLSFSVNNSNQKNNAESNAVQGNILPVARKIAVPELFKDDGSIFTNSDLLGHWSLVFFGYTHCPDICPTTLGVLAQAKKSFKNNPDLSGIDYSGINSPEIDFPAVIFVSVDPGRDTVDVLNDYVKYFDSTFTGVTGKPELIQALTLQMSVVYMPPAEASVIKDYSVDHSSSVLVINPQGKLHAFLNPPHSVTSIVESVRALMN